jgi:large repetitive protein
MDGGSPDTRRARLGTAATAIWPDTRNGSPGCGNKQEPVLGTAAADYSMGAWSIESAKLSDGSHTLSVSATDAAGNTSSASTVAFTIDTTPPTSLITSLTQSNKGVALSG